ncbi:hypothetical protein [Microbacterium schleiferi]|uniref:hypothetical protein n=1 Tax=Microbacterium schleiferi TaxID=69362 RepID=UPI00311F3B64
MSRKHLLDEITFHNRAEKTSRPSISRNWNPLPRTVFEFDPDTLDLYDRLISFREAVGKFHRLASESTRAANDAADTYRRNVREVIANGGDPATVTSGEAAHTAQAAAYVDLAGEAQAGADNTARELAARLGDTATDYIPPADEQLEKVTATMRKAITALEKSWAEYSRAWQIRRIFGTLALNGGLVGSFDPNPAVPAQVREALDELTTRLTDLDTLRRDEELMTQWRAANPAAELHGVTA